MTCIQLLGLYFNSIFGPYLKIPVYVNLICDLILICHMIILVVWISTKYVNQEHPLLKQDEIFLTLSGIDEIVLKEIQVYIFNIFYLSQKLEIEYWDKFVSQMERQTKWLLELLLEPKIKTILYLSMHWFYVHVFHNQNNFIEYQVQIS